MTPAERRKAVEVMEKALRHRHGLGFRLQSDLCLDAQAALTALLKVADVKMKENPDA